METAIETRRSFFVWFVQTEYAQMVFGILVGGLLIALQFLYAIPTIFHYGEERLVVHDLYIGPNTEIVAGIAPKLLNDIGIESDFNEYRAKATAFVKEYLVIGRGSSGVKQLDYYGFPSSGYGYHTVLRIKLDEGNLAEIHEVKTWVRDNQLFIKGKLWPSDLGGAFVVYWLFGFVFPVAVVGIVVRFLLVPFLKSRYKRSLIP